MFFFYFILALGSSFDENSQQLYFQQCFIIEKKLGAGSFGEVSVVFHPG